MLSLRYFFACEIFYFFSKHEIDGNKKVVDTIFISIKTYRLERRNLLPCSRKEGTRSSRWYVYDNGEKCFIFSVHEKNVNSQHSRLTSHQFKEDKFCVASMCGCVCRRARNVLSIRKLIMRKRCHVVKPLFFATFSLPPCWAKKLLCFCQKTYLQLGTHGTL